MITIPVPSSFSTAVDRHPLVSLSPRRPAAPAGCALPAALAATLARLAGGAGLRHQFTLAGQPVTLSPSTVDGLLLLTEAALLGLRYHATAGEVRVRLEYDAGGRCLCLSIEDDGQGFDRRHPLAGGLLLAADDPDPPALHAWSTPMDRQAAAEDLDPDAIPPTVWADLYSQAAGLGGTLRIAAGRGQCTVLELEVPYP